MSMFRSSVRFEVVKRTTKRQLKCRTCKRRFVRQQTFEQTINPWNKNAIGEPKNFREIWIELGVECDAWDPDDLCTRCAEESDG